jgi:hypothetical protein
VISFCVLAVLARSINLGFSEHVVRAEAVYSVLALSAFNAGPLAAKAIGVIPRKRKTEVMIEKKLCGRFQQFHQKNQQKGSRRW